MRSMGRGTSADSTDTLLRTFLAQSMLATDVESAADSEAAAVKGKVTLSTVHSAKGLEVSNPALRHLTRLTRFDCSGQSSSSPASRKESTHSTAVRRLTKSPRREGSYSSPLLERRCSVSSRTRRHDD